MLEKIEILFNEGRVIKVTTEKDVPEPSHPNKESIKELPVNKDTPAYLVGSRFLYDCYRHLMSRDTEVLHDVSGVENEGLYTLERLEPLELDESSAGYAKSNLLSTRDALIGMHKFGYLLTGVFHSHPSKGRSAVNPSVTDFNNQKQLEDAGFACISGVFSKDGWIRFFTVNRPFKLIIRGKGVERVEEKLLRLVETESL